MITDLQESSGVKIMRLILHSAEAYSPHKSQSSCCCLAAGKCSHFSFARTQNLLCLADPGWIHHGLPHCMLCWDGSCQTVMHGPSKNNSFRLLCPRVFFPDAGINKGYKCLSKWFTMLIRYFIWPIHDFGGYSILGTTQDTPSSFVRSDRGVHFDGIITDDSFDDSGNFKSLLLQLSNSLRGNELRELKFQCGDVLPIYVLETINHGFQLFQALEHHNMLSVRKRDFLASKLIAVNRIDLRDQLLGLEG